MSPTFTINFRREIYQRELARSRARVISLGIWLSYFGALSVIFGLYGLNCAAVSDRTRMVERMVDTQRNNSSPRVDWSKQVAEIGMLERAVSEGGRWRQRLERLAIALPANARLESIAFNPGGVSGGGDWNRLVLTGVLRAQPNQDRMREVSNLVAALQADTILATHFRSIRLASTRITETAGTTAEFVIECRP